MNHLFKKKPKTFIGGQTIEQDLLFLHKISKMKRFAFLSYKEGFSIIYQTLVGLGIVTSTTREKGVLSIVSLEFLVIFY